MIGHHHRQYMFGVLKKKIVLGKSVYAGIKTLLTQQEGINLVSHHFLADQIPMFPELPSHY